MKPPVQRHLRDSLCVTLSAESAAHLTPVEHEPLKLRELAQVNQVSVLEGLRMAWRQERHLGSQMSKHAADGPGAVSKH